MAAYTHHLQSHLPPPPKILHEDAVVSNLINNNPHCWNVELIDEIFLPRDTSLIKSLPLSFRKPRDVLIWVDNPKGLFTVKSAYHLLQKDAQRSGMGESSSNLSIRKFWNSLWSIQAPRKIQLFLWRTAHDILPTNKNLFSRGISPSYSYGVCSEEPESIQHLLWECNFAVRCGGIVPSVTWLMICTYPILMKLSLQFSFRTKATYQLYSQLSLGSYGGIAMIFYMGIQLAIQLLYSGKHWIWLCLMRRQTWPLNPLLLLLLHKVFGILLSGLLHLTTSTN